jgi:hypothetical protein
MAVLPRTIVLEVAFRAREPQRVPAMPSTALHGALGHALRKIACVEPRRSDCDGCDQAERCAYPSLAEPAGARGAGEGVADRAPPPIVLAPIDMALGERFLTLREGESLRFRVCLVGEKALRSESLVLAALSRAGRFGIGVTPGAGGAKSSKRPQMELGSAVEVEACRGSGPAAEVVFATPARLTLDGRVSGEVDADLLWRSVLRRADTLSRCYGGGALVAGGSEPPAPFAMKDRATRVVAVERYSSRQRSRMVWPGVVGTARLEGGQMPEAWPLLRFAERVQIGKGTACGFGRVRFGGTSTPSGETERAEMGDT